MPSSRIALLIVLLTVGASFGRPIDTAMKKSVDASKNSQLIDDEVKALAAKLADGDPAERAAARNALVDLATVPGTEPASPQYLDVLAESVNTQLLPLLSNENVLVRLNAAIAIAKIAGKADNARLNPAVLVLLNDKNEAILLWALRAAGEVAPAVLRNALLAPKDKLMPTIVAVAQANPSPPIVDEAYKALMLNHTTRRPPANIWKPMVATATTQVDTLIKSRLNAYKTGVPPEPMLEVQAANFLVHPFVLKELSKNQIDQSLQVIYDLMNLAAQRSTTATGAERDALIRVVKDVASCLQASADLQGKGNEMKAVLDPLRLANQTTSNLPALAAKVGPALKAIGVTVTPTTLPTTGPGK